MLPDLTVYDYEHRRERWRERGSGRGRGRWRERERRQCPCPCPCSCSCSCSCVEFAKLIWTALALIYQRMTDNACITVFVHNDPVFNVKFLPKNPQIPLHPKSLPFWSQVSAHITPVIIRYVELLGPGTTFGTSGHRNQSVAGLVCAFSLCYKPCRSTHFHQNFFFLRAIVQQSIRLVPVLLYEL